MTLSERGASGPRSGTRDREPCRCGAEGRLVRSLIGSHGFVKDVVLAADKKLKLKPHNVIESTHSCVCNASQANGANACWACAHGYHRREKVKG